MPRSKHQIPLTARQRYILIVLSTREATVTDWGAWYPLDCAVVRRVMDQLYVRGLVQVMRWEGARVWGLTRAGDIIVQTLDPKEEIE